MFVRSARRRAFLALVAAAATGAMVSGCIRSPAPRGWLPAAEDAALHAFGSWIVVDDESRAPRAVVEGELIAVDADTIHVMGASSLVSVPRPRRCCVTLTAFYVDYSPMTLWGAAGVLSTLSHGVGGILTAPIWAIAATSAAAGASRAPRIQSGDPAVLRAFARFPHGLPAALDRSTLQPKPWPTPSLRAR